MTAPPHLQELFDRLRNGHHLSPEDEPVFSAVAADPEAYIAWFAPLGLRLVRHPRDFFYFEPDAGDAMPPSLPRIAVFAYVLIDHLANAGRPIEETLFGERFLVSKLPHFALDRHAALLRQVEVEDAAGLRLIVKHLERLGWARFTGDDEFRFLRPFHRVLDQCLAIARTATAPATPTATDRPLPPA